MCVLSGAFSSSSRLQSRPFWVIRQFGNCQLITIALIIVVATTQAQFSIYEFESDANGFNTKTFFYDNGIEVVAFGGQFTPQLATKAIDFLRTKTLSPISYLVVTHPNPDKFNGATVFQQQGAKVISSRSTSMAIAGVHTYKKYYFVHIAKMFTEETYPVMPSIDLVFEKQQEIYLANGDKMILKELSSPGISSTQTIAILPQAHAVMVGDLVHHKAHAWLEGGIVNGKAKATISGWIADLKELQQIVKPTMTIYGGRGKSVASSIAIAKQIEYLQKAKAIVKSYIEKLGTKKHELTGDKAAIHHREIEKIFVATFAEYKLGYMIGFGIYGLINACLEN